MTDEEPAKPEPEPKFTDPFAFEDIEYRVGPTNKKARDKDSSLPKKGQALPYITADACRDRLDAVWGPNWSCSYREAFMLSDKNATHVECTITLHTEVGMKDIRRSDVGEGREGSGATGDPVKMAYTDAFKRTCQSLGIGRFLHRLPRDWVLLNDYDEIVEDAFGPEGQLRKSYDYFMQNGAAKRRRGGRATAKKTTAQRPAVTSGSTVDPRIPKPTDPVIPPQLTQHHATVKAMLTRLFDETDRDFANGKLVDIQKLYPHATNEKKQFASEKLTAEEAQKLAEALGLVLANL